VGGEVRAGIGSPIAFSHRIKNLRKYTSKMEEATAKRWNMKEEINPPFNAVSLESQTTLVLLI
jgi:hypothetical protein